MPTSENDSPIAHRCTTRTVDDAPASRDEFGTHSPIADAIHELIETESGGRTIGLEGGWGSGKSTVARILANRIRESGHDRRVVLFDAWAHEGDPLRRSFLEKLIAELTREPCWLDKGCWAKRRKELARRRRVETTRPTATVKPPAIIAAAAAAAFAALLSFGAALIGAGMSSEHSWAFSTGVSVSVLAFALPILAAAIALAIGNFSSTGKALFVLFSVQSVTETTREAIETPDPTSIEFESTFNDLMREALCDKNRRFVLMIDNLDRIAPDDARKIWSTLQAFLHHSIDDCKPWLERLWVLLPYDREGIARLWQPIGPISGGSGITSTKAEAGTNEKKSKDQPEIADSFIEKSVQVRFEVPSTLLSDWRGYLESTLAQALPECPDADPYAAFSLYSRQLASEARAPSPRQIKQYINRIGVLHRRWQHRLPFSSLSYYASLDMRGAEVAERLRSGSIPDNTLRGLLPEDIEGHLAAIALNAEPERAQGLLLGPLIDHALLQETPRELAKLDDRHGFWDLLPHSQILSTTVDFRTLLTAARRLMEIPIEHRPGSEWSEVKSLVRQCCSSINPWPPLTEESAKRFFSLLALLDQEDAAELVARVAGALVRDDSVSDWAPGAHALLSQFDWVNLEIPGPPGASAEILADIAGLDGWESLASRLSAGSSVRTSPQRGIVSLITDRPDDALKALSVRSRIKPPIDWAPFVETAAKRLRDGSPSSATETPLIAGDSRDLLQILKSAPGRSPRERKAIVDEGLALEYFDFAHQSDNPKALGDWLLEEFRHFPPDSQEARGLSGQAQAGKNAINQMLTYPQSEFSTPLAEAIERESEFAIVPSFGATPPGEELAKSLMAELWNSAGFLATISGEHFHACWPLIVGAAESHSLDAIEFVVKVSHKPTFVEELMAKPIAVDRISMYDAVLRASPNAATAAELATRICDRLSQWLLESWQEAMTTADDWILLASAVRDAAPYARIEGTFAQALVWFLKRVTEGAEPSSAGFEHWRPSIAPLLNPDLTGAYAVGLAGVANSAGTPIPQAFFELAGDDLKNPEMIERQEVKDGFFPKLVTEQDIAGLIWLDGALRDAVGHDETLPGKLGALAAVVRATINAESAAPEISEIVRSIAQTLGIGGDSNAGE